jgi:hypothetical protein
MLRLAISPVWNPGRESQTCTALGRIFAEGEDSVSLVSQDRLLSYLGVDVSDGQGRL